MDAEWDGTFMGKENANRVVSQHILSLNHLFADTGIGMRRKEKKQQPCCSSTSNDHTSQSH